MTELRPYQREAIDAVHAYWDRGGGNPLVDLATGTGKSVVLAQLVRDVVEEYDARALVLTHVKELVEQDLRATLRLWPQCPAGINSAGLGRRDLRSQVLFASIQSVFKQNGYSLGKRHLVIVDEAHLVPRSGDGMYLTLINKLREVEPELRVVGLTATPYRLDSGRLNEGDGRLFDDIVYSYGIGEGVRDGYLSPLKSPDLHVGIIDARGIAKLGGEFKASALEAAANKDALVKAAVADILARGQDRRGWILFCSGVDHCETVRAELASHGVAVASVTGETPKDERDRAIRAFKAGQLRALTSVGVLTTGFDAPHVDLIAMLRPTLSTGLYVQMLGRGTRLAAGKDNCLVLDYSGNVRRHGPVDAIEILGRGQAAGKSEKTEVDTVRAKACPQCSELVALRTMECLDCGYQWPVEPKHEARADEEAAVMIREVEERWLTVDGISARPHISAAGNASLRVDYFVGLKAYTDWVSLGQFGWPGEKAAAWWKRMTGMSAEGVDVDGADRLIREGDAKIDCSAIRIKRDGKYWRVVERLRSDGFAVDEKLKLRAVERRVTA